MAFGNATIWIDLNSAGPGNITRKHNETPSMTPLPSIKDISHNIVMISSFE